jgi:hypothetical protein
MRTGLAAVFVALLLATIAGQNSLLQSTGTEAESNSAITACAVQGADCDQRSLDSFPGSDVKDASNWVQDDLVLEHVVFSGGCASADLHVVRYVPDEGTSGEAVVARWCA